MYKVQRMLPKIVKFLYHFDKEILSKSSQGSTPIYFPGLK